MIDGQDLPAFREIGLAESWVVDVVVRPRSVVLLLEAAITVSSPRWRPPRPNEAFWWLPAEVRFLGVTAVHWTDHEGPTLDLDGTIDYGNVDALRVDGDRYVLQTGAGIVDVTAASLSVTFLPTDDDGGT